MFWCEAASKAAERVRKADLFKIGPANLSQHKSTVTTTYLADISPFLNPLSFF